MSRLLRAALAAGYIALAPTPTVAQAPQPAPDAAAARRELFARGFIANQTGRHGEAVRLFHQGTTMSAPFDSNNRFTRALVEKARAMEALGLLGLEPYDLLPNWDTPNFRNPPPHLTAEQRADNALYRSEGRRQAALIAAERARGVAIFRQDVVPMLRRLVGRYCHWGGQTEVTERDGNFFRSANGRAPEPIRNTSPGDPGFASFRLRRVTVAGVERTLAVNFEFARSIVEDDQRLVIGPRGDVRSNHLRGIGPDALYDCGVTQPDEPVARWTIVCAPQFFGFWNARRC